MTPVLAFDIETVPDVAGIRRLYGIDSDVADSDVAEFAMARRRVKTGSDFLPVHLQRVVAIACALREGETFRVWSLGSATDSEPELIRRFFDGIERYTPQIVSWNGSGFDMPVMHYRSLSHGLAAPRYWDMGDDDRDFRYNNYINRYHTRHLDLMDLLALYNGRNYAPLDELAKLSGFPGKLGMDGSQVWGAFQRGEIQDIRNYCETDTANTYLIFLRFQLLRGAYDETRYRRELELVRTTLAKSEAPHWKEFLDAWPPG
jgi:predicted PolB exonuclease-like 3'-5' exonuclease